MQGRTLAELVGDAVHKQTTEAGSVHDPIMIDDNESEQQSTKNNTSTIRKRQGRGIGNRLKSAQYAQAVIHQNTQQRDPYPFQHTAPLPLSYPQHPFPPGTQPSTPGLPRPAQAGNSQTTVAPLIPLAHPLDATVNAVTADTYIPPTLPNLRVSPLNTMFALSRGLNEPWIGFIHAPETVKRAVADLTVNFADSKTGGDAMWYIKLLSETARPTKCLRMKYAGDVEAAWTKESAGEYACRSCTSACQPCCVWNPHASVKLIMVLPLHPALRPSVDPGSKGYWLRATPGASEKDREEMRKVFGDAVTDEDDAVEAG